MGWEPFGIGLPDRDSRRMSRLQSLKHPKNHGGVPCRRAGIGWKAGVTFINIQLEFTIGSYASTSTGNEINKP